MKKVSKILLLLGITFWSTTISGQLITTNTSLTPEQLVQETLGNDCIEISNVTSNINGSVDGLNSFGRFNRAGSSFPFADGFLITSGNATSAGNTMIPTNLSEGTGSWGGDADLEAALGTTGTLNATVIEFDIVSVTDQISFNYLLASEEYQQNNPCNVADGFALLIRPNATATPYSNIALIPGTTIPVGIDTIHPEIVGECAAANETFFAGNNLGATNYEGRTTVLTASASVVPNQSYHLKMVIADQFDAILDTAIFIESGSLVAEVDLGPDQTPCESTTLDGDVGNSLASYEWLRNGVPISGENNSTLFVDQGGTYTVRVTIPLSTSTCVISDDVVINIDPDQLSPNIPDFDECDDNNDGVFDFDLNAIAADIEANHLPASTYDIDFYISSNDAMLETNALTSPFTNSNNPETVFVRINDLVSNCFGITSFDLIVNPAPTAADLTIELCDDATADGSVAITLSDYNNQVTQGVAGLNVSYHPSPVDAQNNTNALLDNFTNTSNPETLYVRVENPSTSCFANSTIEFNVNPLPVLANTTATIDACDADGDGFATFDITSVENDFTMGLSNISVSYHEVPQDAIDDTNAIPDPTAFTNTIPRVQTVYIRVEDTSSSAGCASIGTIQLFTNLLLDATDIGDVTLCDDPSNDGVEDFDFPSIETIFINGLPNVNITFYETPDDRQNGINPIDETVQYTNTANPQTIYITITSPTCTEIAQFDLNVEPYFESEPIPDQIYCDTDQDGFTTIILNTFDNVVRGSFDATHSVSYFTSSGDADTGSNPITTIDNTTNPITVFARLTAPTGCSDNQPLTIEVLPAPLANTPTGFVICDDDQDGMFIIDLSSKEPEITTDANRSFSYHLTSTDADEDMNEIVDFQNYNAQTGTVFVRVENTSTGCHTVVSQSILINTLPLFPTITPYQLCETDGDNIEDFFFNTKDNEILNGQSGKEVLYFEDENDAINRINIIDKTAAFQNTSDPQTIWARVENISDIDCFGVAPFTIQVDESPTYNDPSDIDVCDDNNDGFFTFDLRDAEDEITAGITNNLTVTFHLNPSNADMGINPQPLDFTNTRNPQTIYARIGNDLNCFAVEPIILNVIESPETTPPSTAYTLCDSDLDGMTTFDLSTREAEITGPRLFNTTLTWHTDPTEAEEGVNAIADPNNFVNTSNPQPVYLRVFNTITRCHSVQTLDLVVNLPPTINTITEYRFCENSAGEVDLSEIDASFTTATAGISIAYFASQPDADSNTNALPNPYSYIGPSQNIVARVTNTTTSCFITTNFDLIIENSPAIATPQPLRACDDDFDGLLGFDLSDRQDEILNGLSASDHQVTYYTTPNDANDAINAINPVVEATDQQLFYARVVSNTGCFSVTSIETRVDPLPVIPVRPIEPLCGGVPATINADTGVAGETYRWSTGAISPSIVVATPGDYWVEVTSPSPASCTAPRVNFSVINSETANIDFTTKIDFSDPNSITVNVSGIGDYRFQLDDGPWEEGNMPGGHIFNDVTRGYHQVTVLDLNGCEPSPPETVLVLDYPKFFTPNSDGYNDRWQIIGLENFGGSSIHIFDRYGKLLKTLGHLSSGWDGTFNGTPLPASDYWFVLKVVDVQGDIEVKGHFTLKR
ncbi:choice-of-anchor L domain-containing protein [Sungkyunkwania multivorans]|uniref:Choice-of-anchor L domain-containing protein n=1 Tax=Sungkyunkwania multivorans TaxID=1173618 RepID=A0ABW3D3A7_9FLAO